MDSPDIPGAPLQPGDTLSHYRLIEKIGEGGMGVVWKARDEKLRRDIALKLLPPALVGDPERRRRLLREARTGAAVNHPNVAMILEVDEADGLVFVAMELVDGRPLRALLAEGPLPIPVALRLAAETAEGLAGAHGSGVVHRDLKPENVMVRPDGHVKILDFGLAKLLDDRPALDPANLSEAETVTQEMTREGRILGTPAYMSPEQARGESVDARSDVFSFGSMLYEMVSGKRPFEGRTHVDTLAAVLKEPASPPSRLNPAVTPELERILDRCLAKDREERYQGTDELAVDLRELQGTVEVTVPFLRWLRARAARLPRGFWIPAAVVALVALVTGAWLLRRTFVGPDPRTLLILPLEVRGQDAGADYVGRAFAETLAQKLTMEHGLEVLQVPEVGELGDGGTEAKARAARERGAGQLLTGSVTRDGGKVIRARISLVDPAANQIVWGTDAEVGEGKNALSSLASGLAREVATHLGAVAAQFYDFIGAMTRNEELARSPAYIQALAAVRRWDLEAAVPEVEKLMEAFPDEPDALLLAVDVFPNAGLLLGTPGLAEKAIEACEKLEQIDPHAPWGDLCRTYALWHNDPDGKIVGEFTSVLARDDLTVALRSGLLGDRGEKRSEQGDQEGAVRDWKESLRLDPTNVWPHIHYGWHLLTKYRTKEGLDLLRKAFALGPHNPMSQWSLGELLFHYGEWDEARAPLRNHCEGLMPNQESCAQYAYVLHRTGHPEEARDTVGKAGSMEDSLDGMWVLAAYWALAGEEARAVEMLRREAEAHDTPIFLRGHLDLSSLRGDPGFEALAAAELKEAVAHYGEVCASDPRRRPCALHAVALHLSGRESEAREVAARAASLEEPDSLGRRVAALDALAWYHALARDRDEVIRHLRRRAELLGEVQVPTAHAHSIRAWRLAEHRDYAWLRGDPEFDALAASLDASAPGGSDDAG